MTISKSKSSNDQEHLARLQAYYAEYRTFPSYARLMDLLGFASKSAIKKVLERLEVAGMLERTPDGDWAPSDRFFERTVASQPVPAGTPVSVANKVQPSLLHAWLKNFEIPAPPSDEAEIKPWRNSLQEAIYGFDNVRRANIEGMAERIVVLADRAGQEAIVSLREIIPDIEELDAQPDAVHRSLWLFVKAPQRFAESEDSRFAIEYRMSPRLYSGFEGPAEQPIQLDQARLDVLKEKVRDTLGIQGSILIEHFVRSAFSDNDDDVSLHHITVAYNAEQNSYEHIVGKQPGQRARSIPVTITAPNNCSNSGLTENDRQLRDRLLESWGILVKF